MSTMTYRDQIQAWEDLKKGYADPELRRRLRWARGDDADAIIEGRDLKANQDLVAWRNLGEPK